MASVDCRVDIFDARSQTPTIDQLADYDGLIVYSNFSFHDHMLLGDLLATYVDSNMGGVVVCAFAHCRGNLAIKGKFCAKDSTYLPVTVEPQTNLPITDKGSAIFVQEPTHPILANVKLLDAGRYRSKCSIKPLESKLIAKYNDDVPMIVESTVKRVVVCNFFCTSSLCSSDSWKATTDGSMILFNALMYVSNL